MLTILFEIIIIQHELSFLYAIEAASFFFFFFKF
jgi:hypothetical protein